MKQEAAQKEQKATESRPARGAWIETKTESILANITASRPARGAWIETNRRTSESDSTNVAPRTGRVD